MSRVFLLLSSKYYNGNKLNLNISNKQQKDKILCIPFAEEEILMSCICPNNYMNYPMIGQVYLRKLDR